MGTNPDSCRWRQPNQGVKLIIRFSQCQGV
jgi:hypothetical protein